MSFLDINETRENTKMLHLASLLSIQHDRTTNLISDTKKLIKEAAFPCPAIRIFKYQACSTITNRMRLSDDMFISEVCAWFTVESGVRCSRLSQATAVSYSQDKGDEK